jgi:hypothetical protein
MSTIPSFTVSSADKSFVVTGSRPPARTSSFNVRSSSIGFNYDSEGSGDNIRMIVNDGVVPLTCVDGCAADTIGRCALNKFVAGKRWCVLCSVAWSAGADARAG